MAKKPTSPQNATPLGAAGLAPTTMPANLPTGRKELLIAEAGLSMSPTLFFYPNFTQVVRGDLSPTPASPKLILCYSAARLPDAVATSSNWQGTAYVSYGNGETPLALPIYPPSQQPVINGGNAGVIGFGEAQVLTMYNLHSIPADAQDVAVWFSFELSDGQVFWDSNYGQNYHFGFTNDVQVVAANISGPEPGAPYASLGVSVNAGADVTAVIINYIILNATNIPMQGQAILTATGITPQGSQQWQLNSLLMRAYAVVYFTINYTARGNAYVDDNNGQGYLVS